MPELGFQNVEVPAGPLAEADGRVTALENTATVGGNPCRFWVMTIQIDADDAVEAARRLEWTPPVAEGHLLLRYVVMQRERGHEANRLHWQGYVQLNRPCRARQVREIMKCPWAWVKPARGTPDQCRAYCTKEDTRVEGTTFYENGTLITQQGKRNDLAGVYDIVKTGGTVYDVMREHGETYIRYHSGIDRAIQLAASERSSSVMRDLNVIVIWGPPGSGKTKWVYDNYPLADIYSLTIGGSGRQWWDGYINQPVVLVDDFAGNLPYRYLLRCTDRYPMQVEVKGSSVYLQNTTIVFTSNLHWADWYSKEEERKDIRALQRRITKVIHVPVYGVEPLVEERGTPPTLPENWVTMPVPGPLAPGFVLPPQHA